MNRVLIINGTYGIGKTTTSKLLKDYYKNTIEVLDPDHYYNELVKTNLFFLIGWSMQKSHLYLKFFRSKVDAVIKEKSVVIPITISTDICKKELYDYLSERTELIHIILDASDDVIIDRINKDKGRAKEFSKESIVQNKEFLICNFPDAIWIDTSTKDKEKVAEEIIALLR